jgi:hypothetical protein
MYILAIAIGTALSAVLVSLAKSRGGADVDIEESNRALVHA